MQDLTPLCWDYDHYNSQQTSASGGFSFTFGTGAANAYLSLSRQKIKSDYESVVQQTGFYAGTGGFDIKVGEHTQLNGSVLGSHAAADQNHLSTGTLGWSNLDNKAEYHVESQTIGFSGGTSLSAAQNSLATAASMAASLMGGNSSGSASSTSYAAISPANIEIRNQDQQQQDVTGISRDVEHAANGLSPIFNKQRELDRLQEAQLIGEIGQQAVQIAVTYANLPVEEAKGRAADKVAEADQASKEALALRASGKSTAADAKQAIADAAILEASSLNKQAKVLQEGVDKNWGLTSNFQIAARAASAALQGLAGGNMGQAVSGAAAPYLAGVIKDLTYDPVSKKTNQEANVMVHALLGAVVAQASGGNAAAGAIGGGSAPLVGGMISSLISKEVYDKDDPSKLTEEQKQTVSALTTLAGTMAGAAVGGNSAAALTGGQAAKNEVENNLLGDSATDRYLYAHKSKVLQNLVQRANQSGSSQGLKMAAGLLVLAGTPAAAKMAVNCASNPVCLNEAAIAIGEMAAGDALPVGLGGTALAKSAEKYFAEKQAGHSATAKAALAEFSQNLDRAASKTANNAKVAAKVEGSVANPLLADAIPRNGKRQVLNQGRIPTCGANSCSMVLDSMGKKVDVSTLIQRVPPSAKGITSHQVAVLMESEGVAATAFGGRNVSDLARYTVRGTPVVVRIADKTGDFSHFVVVDGITTRNGIPVVAIRDPHGAQYFSPVATFRKNFTGEVIVPKPVIVSVTQRR